MKAGDHLVTSRTGYTHHGLYVGNGKVIHYSGGSDNIFSKGKISLTSLGEFANGCNVSVKEHFIRTYDEVESVNRAYSRLNEDWYNVLLNNCEHFITWCIVGFHSSSQVNNKISAITVAYTAMKVASTPQIAQSLIGQIASSTGLRYAVSSSAGSFSGLAVSSSSVASGTVGLVAGTPLMPAVATIAITVAVGYGAKKAFDWLFD